MKQTVYTTAAFLSNCNHEHPTLEFIKPLPKYNNIKIKDYTFGNIVTPTGFDEDGTPYFSDEFYQELQNEYDRVIKFDRERARNIFWFDVTVEIKFSTQ